MKSISKSLKLLAFLPWLILRPRAARHIIGTALGACQEVIGRDCDVTRLPGISMTDLALDKEARIGLSFFGRFGCSVAPVEALCLGLLVRRTAAQRVFEFGTFLGISTTQLALNVAEGGSVFTLDLPEDDPRFRLPIGDESEVDLTMVPDKGRLVPGDLRSKIIFLKKDSADFDESPYVGTMDFVFVDGAHSAAYVRNDSEKGWRMLKSGGIIAWHDCRPQDPDVVNYLVDCPYHPRRIGGTTLAFAVKP